MRFHCFSFVNSSSKKLFVLSQILLLTEIKRQNSEIDVDTFQTRQQIQSF